jgi:hypothetical protein
MIEKKKVNTGLIVGISILGLYGLFLVGAFCVMSIFVVNYSKNSLTPLPTPTLDLACEDANCLQMCLGRVPEFVVQPLYGHEEDLSNRPDGFEITRYRLDEQTNELEKVATPSVPDYLKPYQKNTELHRQIWDYFTAVIPQTPELHVSYMIVYTDGMSDGYAARIWDLGDKWRLYVDIFDFDNAYNVTDILVHEYGHMLTLNDTQITYMNSEYGLKAEYDDFIKMSDKCSRFFNGYGCAKENSYLNQYGQRFWTGDVYESWIKVFLTEEEKDGDRDAAVENFYSQYPDQFVSHYAATDPDEDIAESWEAFVMQPKPTGNTIADQKVLFFYEFPELVQQRREIIQAVCKYAAGHE